MEDKIRTDAIIRYDFFINVTFPFVYNEIWKQSILFYVQNLYCELTIPILINLKLNIKFPIYFIQIFSDKPFDTEIPFFI